MDSRFCGNDGQRLPRVTRSHSPMCPPSSNIQMTEAGGVLGPCSAGASVRGNDGRRAPRVTLSHSPMCPPSSNLQMTDGGGVLGPCSAGACPPPPEARGNAAVRLSPARNRGSRSYYVFPLDAVRPHHPVTSHVQTCPQPARGVHLRSMHPLRRSQFSPSE